MEIETWTHGDRDIETWRYGHMGTYGHMDNCRNGDMGIETSNAKRKMEAQAIFLNQFTICSSCTLKFVICKQKLSVCKWTEWTKRTKCTERT
jgi:hypothetical protein